MNKLYKYIRPEKPSSVRTLFEKIEAYLFFDLRLVHAFVFSEIDNCPNMYLNLIKYFFWPTIFLGALHSRHSNAIE